MLQQVTGVIRENKLNEIKYSILYSMPQLIKEQTIIKSKPEHKAFVKFNSVENGVNTKTLTKNGNSFSSANAFSI